MVAGLVVCLLFGSIGVSYVARNHAFRSRAQRYGAHVVANEFRDRSYHPVVEFHDVEGQTVRVTSAMGFDVGGGPMYATGDAVTVLYSEKDPAATRIESVFDRWGMPALCCLAAFLALVFFAGGAATPLPADAVPPPAGAEDAPLQPA